MRQIVDGVWSANLGIANIGVLALPTGGVALIDTGANGSKDKIKKALASENFKLEDIKHILITHAHADHVGDLKKLVDISSATVWAHQKEARVIRGLEPQQLPLDKDLSIFGRLMKRLAPQPAKGVVHKELIDANLDIIMPGLRAIPLPGHSPGQLGYYLESSRTLFGGDCCMNILGLRLPLAAFTLNMRQAKQSLQIAAKLEANHLIVGHGSPILNVAAKKLRQLAQHFAV